MSEFLQTEYFKTRWTKTESVFKKKDLIWSFTVVTSTIKSEGSEWVRSSILWRLLFKLQFKVKNRGICDHRAFDFLNYESTWDLTIVPASMYDRETDAWRFYANYDFSVSRNLFSNAEMRKFGSVRTDGLIRSDVAEAWKHFTAILEKEHEFN